MPSFRLVILGSLARAVAVLETVEQLGGLEATAPGKSAGLGDLEAVDRLAVEESALGAWWDLRVRGSRILVVQEMGLELKKWVWRGGVLERGNIWAFSPPW